MGKGGYTFLAIVYFIVALYIFNFAFKFISMPDIILSVEKWIFTLAGALILIGGFLHYRKGKTLYS